MLDADPPAPSEGAKTDSPPQPTTARRTQASRVRTVSVVTNFRAARDRRGVSQRAFAHETGVPRTTLQAWIARRNHTGVAPEVVAFFESPAGVQFMNRLFHALLFVLTLVSPSGLRHVAMVLRLSGLDRWLATSQGALHAASVRMDQAVVRVGDAERTRLAATMPPRTIALCEDETYHPAPCLVAIEPSSDFIVVEAYAARRDAATWNDAVARATKDLRVEVEQVTSDLARGIRLHVAQGLHARHHADIFHVQYELSRATGAPLASQVRHALQEQAKAEVALRAVRPATDPAVLPPRADEPRASTPGSVQAERDLQAAQEVVAEAQRQQAAMQQEVRELRGAYHPFDLSTGAPRSSHTVRGELEWAVARIQDLARQAGLSPAQEARMAKTARVIPQLVATIAWVHHRILTRVLALSLPPAARHALLTAWIPGLYLLRVATRTRDTANRAALRERGQSLVTQARGAVLPALPDWLRHHHGDGGERVRCTTRADAR